MMKYRYGVEYETNGEKPDLPSDVLVRVQGNGGKWLGPYPVTGWNWPEIKKFRIVDERYKPKEQDMNDWYEKGELPPVGAVVAFHRSDKHKASIFTEQWCEGDHLQILAHKKGETEDVAVVWNQRLNKACGIVLGCLKPIRTERDVLVEKMCNDTKSAQEKFNINIDCSVAMRGVMDDLIDAGWRPVKQQTEDEFAAQAQELTDYVSIYQLSKLYRAGCRFIEQVKA